MCLGEYLRNIESVWPYDIFHYSEELALFYLLLKNYDLELALTTVLYNCDELIKMLTSKYYYM